MTSHRTSALKRVRTLQLGPERPTRCARNLALEIGTIHLSVKLIEKSGDSDPGEVKNGCRERSHVAARHPQIYGTTES